MLLRRFVLALVSTGLVAQQALAHPGHAIESVDSTAILHYVVHPDHLSVWMGIVAVAAAIWIAGRSYANRPIPAYARQLKPRQGD